MRAQLIRALRQLGFAAEELVYLALSSKVERQVVDRLAWQLHRAGGLVATREWHRTDLAIFGSDHGLPLALLEAKAFSSFAAVRQPDKYPGQMRRDVEKATRLVRDKGGDPDLFVLAVMTHPEAAAPDHLKGLVKYPFWFREPPVFEEASEAVGRFLEPYGPVDQMTLQRGQAWGVPARVEAWLCGPIRA